MKKHVGKIIAGIVCISFILNYFFYWDISGNCFITVRPSLLEFSNLSIKEALKVLKFASPSDYQLVCANVSTINPNISCGGHEGGCFYKQRPRTIDISTTNRSLAWTSTIIVHETCHAIQYKQGRPMGEKECDEMMTDALSRIVEY